MSLYSELCKDEDSEALIYLGCKARRKEILGYISSLAPELAQFKAKKIALHCHSAGNMALSLLTFDGIASELLVFPPSLELAEMRAYYTRLGMDYLISSEAGLLDGLATRNPVSWDELVAFQDRNEGGDHSASIDTRWILLTSGTTGTPKTVSHSLRGLTRTVKRDVTTGSRLVWGLLYELSRFAGLQVFFQALLGGSALIITSPGAELEEVIEELSSSGCNALSATPSMWRKIMMTSARRKLKLEMITLGGEIADQQILNALKAEYPHAKIRHIYASTEAGVGFTVSDGRAGFPSSYLHSPPKGVLLRIDENQVLHLKSESMEQYCAITRKEIADQQGWIDTGDIVEVKDDRCYFKGRKNGAINVGGQKVHPHEVESIILSVSGVAETFVYGIKNSIMGNLVHADVVLLPGFDEESVEKKIRSVCATRLEPYKCPFSINFVKEVKLTAAGKIKR